MRGGHERDKSYGRGIMTHRSTMDFWIFRQWMHF
jgi:hypothetical protein